MELILYSALFSIIIIEIYECINYEIFSKMVIYNKNPKVFDNLTHDEQSKFILGCFFHIYYSIVIIFGIIISKQWILIGILFFISNLVPKKKWVALIKVVINTSVILFIILNEYYFKMWFY